MIISYKTDDNHFRIKNHGVISVHYLHDTIKVKIHKRKDLTLNLILLSSAILSLVIGLCISQIFEIVRITAILASAAFFSFSCMLKVYQNVLVLKGKDRRITEIKIDSLDSDEIARQVYTIDQELEKVHRTRLLPLKEMS